MRHSASRSRGTNEQARSTDVFSLRGVAHRVADTLTQLLITSQVVKSYSGSVEGVHPAAFVWSPLLRFHAIDRGELGGARWHWGRRGGWDTPQRGWASVEITE
ncbi:hypothetical protein EYR40_002200 [Pleurotus pulmonarius]|nr:hypothetical protein EYR40_002200 [Pleurotus pulmonarius]